MHLSLALLGALSCLPSTLALPHLQARNSSGYVDWRTFKAEGVNLGGWLCQESTIDSEFWGKYSGGASDEWGLCKHLGPQCGPVLEHRYATYITETDIDKLAGAGVELIRIPTTYAAWIKLPGSHLYSGNQLEYIKKISDYAIKTYGMHVVIDVHSLPGGVNGLTIGEATGHWGWFHNETALDYSLQIVDAVVDFVQNSSYPQSFSISPINEPADSNQDMSVFGTPAALSDRGASWVLKYMQAVVARVAAVNPRIPIMFQGSFKPVEYWSGNFSADTNLIFDVHTYYFERTNVTSQNLPMHLNSDARAKSGDGKFPVFVGEWSIETGSNNSFALRERNFNAGVAAWRRHGQGSTYWTAKFSGNATVAGQGTQADYWSFESFIDHGYVGQFGSKQ
ncbi:putative glucan 1,3-beta-glucosidase precursor [Aspergillus steynii IBT 23096]|uniref:glucan 1,3-beta-glucosidase n=1 Tax=Aspergillus steynii IBT 23096 TaxID=1392250 RepID=A0A2I2FTU0_9EURO|nr:putative glucan 1,3-beta-glucosidase precursor [Aspergillus steynii IBT 23096]PLB43997.1 putative glucan 1,3-beta-glucosidase precursor [Aspergillus steynii IBT 23096]